MNLVPLEKIMWRLLLGAALVLAISLSLAWYADKQEQAHKESVGVFVKKALLPQLRQWDARSLRMLGTDNFQQLNTLDELRQRLDLHALLGPVVELAPPQIAIHRPWFGRTSEPVQAWVVIPASFRQGDRKLRVTLQRTENGPWRLDALSLTP